MHEQVRYRALESPQWRGLLWFVSPPLRSPALAIGGVASAATIGALIAVGHRLGGTGVPFAAISALVLPRGTAFGSMASVVAGALLHVVVMFAWSAVYVWLVRRFSYPVMAAILVAIAQFVVSGIVARVTGAGLASELALGDRLIFALIFAASLVVGMRFALRPLRNA